MELNDRSKSKDEVVRLVADHDVLQEFSDDVAALWCSAPALGSSSAGARSQLESVPVLDAPPSSLEFARDYVSRSRPCIIRNAILVDADNGGHDGGPLTMTLDDLRSVVPPEWPITADVTPDGHGDCIRRIQLLLKEGEEAPGPCFVKPLQQQMSFEEFCRRLRQQQQQSDKAGEDDAVSNRIFRTTENPRSEASETENPNEGVVYYSQQNDCLRKELSPLWEQRLFPKGFLWAEEAFQRPSYDDKTTRVQPDAINLWMGSRQSVSSMHKDHYENLFYVLSGEKVFTLCPPCDVPFLYERPVPEGSFEFIHGQWRVRLGALSVPEADDGGATAQLQSSYVPWVTADVTKDSGDDYPLLDCAHPITVRVQAGELLYLPALWFHRVSQSGETIAINYWYDMDFESPLWCYFRFLQQLHRDAC
jgi:peptidyl-lysine (3S)-dioxygenase / protease